MNNTTFALEFSMNVYMLTNDFKKLLARDDEIFCPVLLRGTLFCGLKQRRREKEKECPSLIPVSSPCWRLLCLPKSSLVFHKLETWAGNSDLLFDYLVSTFVEITYGDSKRFFWLVGSFVLFCF